MGALPLLLLLFCCCLGFGAAIDTISSSHFIKDPDTIVSSSSIFVMGFFSPVNSTKRYAGIWYTNQFPTDPIWVANRDRPLNDSSGIVRISEDGNLVVVNGLQEVLWSSNVSKVAGNSSAQLTDDGNLVLQDTFSGNSIWESFQHPANVLVANAKVSAKKGTGEKTLLTSWSSASDPSVGSFSAGLNPLDVPEAFIWKGSRPYWRSGPWDGGGFNGQPKVSSVYLNGYRLENDGNGTVTLSFILADASIRSAIDLSPEGTLVQRQWIDSTKSWISVGENPETECDFYGKCGMSGRCSIQDSPICSCLRGFEPKNADEWKIGNWASGCVRKTLLQCERTQNGGEVGKEDGFLKMEMVKLPDFGSWSSSNEQVCRESCLNNCSCIAYAFPSDIGCMSWTGDLIDIQQFSTGGADLYIRLAYSELGGDNKNKKVIIITTVVLISIAIAVCAFFSWRWMSKYKVRKRNRENLLHESKDAYPTSMDVTILEDKVNQAKLQEIPLFSLLMLEIATHNFATSDKLGQGGFGPVYKGKFPDGQEIAVKRLSTASGQGLQEFMNEVQVISKLQHRNLVRLLGCCIEGEEKMLVYEYMPNKSLDAFLFSPRKEGLLDWTRRFNIVEGICRGLLYLHRDSRLRIIHRDLKASNILLDHEMNPKISDFGLAKIFEGNQDQAATRRVAGTYGYMAPEYAMEGRFSEKSDVFSFGVLLLEIVSGRKITSFYGDEDGSSLLVYAWKLWNEDNIAALIDPVILDPCSRTEVLRCIHVGLLCVQEFASDRPSMRTVISMLNSEIMDLPTPSQPAFTGRRIALNNDSSSQSEQKCSVNDMTVSIIKGR